MCITSFYSFSKPRCTHLYSRPCRPRRMSKTVKFWKSLLRAWVFKQTNQSLGYEKYELGRLDLWNYCGFFSRRNSFIFPVVPINAHSVVFIQCQLHFNCDDRWYIEKSGCSWWKKLGLFSASLKHKYIAALENTTGTELATHHIFRKTSTMKKMTLSKPFLLNSYYGVFPVLRRLFCWYTRAVLQVQCGGEAGQRWVGWGSGRPPPHSRSSGHTQDNLPQEAQGGI